MLVLTREVGEKILIGSDIIVTLVEIKNGQVQLGIEAPKETHILREEVIKTGDSTLSSY